MKWFKHLSGAMTDNLIFEAMQRFGPAGYVVFFGTLEIMADEFDAENPGSCRIPIKKLTQNLQLSRQKTVKVLRYFQQKSNEPLTKDKSFSVCFEPDHVVIKCNRLAELSDEYAKKKTRKLSGHCPDIVRNLSALDTDTEADIDKNKNKKPPNPLKKGERYTPDFLRFWEQYPKKTGKDAAWKSWQKRNGDRPKIEAILEAIKNQRIGDQWTRDGGQYIPNPATWINQGRWADEEIAPGVIWRPKPDGGGYGTSRPARGGRIPEQPTREDLENIDRINAMARKLYHKPPSDKT